MKNEVVHEFLTNSKCFSCNYYDIQIITSDDKELCFKCLNHQIGAHVRDSSGNLIKEVTKISVDFLG